MVASPMQPSPSKVLRVAPFEAVQGLASGKPGLSPPAKIGWNREALSPHVGKRAFFYHPPGRSHLPGWQVGVVLMLKTSEFLELQKLCQRSFPKRFDQHLSQIEALPDPRHPALALALSWSEGHHPRVERLLVRRYADRWTWWGVDDGRKAPREWAVMRWLYGEGLPVPEVYAGGDDYVLLARPAGRGPAERGEEWRPLVEPWVDSLAGLLARLHQLLPPLQVREVLSEVAVSDELARLGDLARQCGDGGLDEAVVELRGYHVDGGPPQEGHPPCVLLGDAIFASARLDARGITALAHWESSAQGDPRWDVARALLWLRARQADDLADRFLAAYEELVGQALGEMAFWMALAGAQSWALTAWLRENAPGASLVSQQDTWIEQTWRALTRLRIESSE